MTTGYPAVDILLAIALGLGCIVAGLYAIALLAPLIYDVRVRGGSFQIVLLRVIPVASFRRDRIVDASVDDDAFRFTNPFRTLRLLNRMRRGYVVIERRGLLKYIIVTPRDPDGFIAALKA